MELREYRLACLKEAVIIAGRQQQNVPKTVIAIADELCQYVLSGNSKAGSVSGDAEKTEQPDIDQSEGVAAKADNT